MAYADVAAVQVELGKMKSALTATSNPTLDDVTNKILPDISGQIDAVLSSRGLTVPVTAPASFLDRLKGLNAVGAAARVVAALFPQAAGPSSTLFAQWLQDRFDAGLQMLRDGEGIPDTAVLSGSSMPTSLWTSHPGTDSSDLDNGTPGNTTDPVFRRDTQW